MTSDEYLQSRKDSVDIHELSWQHKRKLAERLGFSMEAAAMRLIDRFWHRGTRRPWS